MKSALKIVLPILVVGLGVTSMVLLVKFRKQVAPNPPEVLPPLVESVVVSLTNHQFRVHTQGTVQPRTQIQLAAEVAGKVVEVSPSFDAGGFFQEGDILLRIEANDFAAAVTRAQAQVAEARYRLAFESAEAEVAREEWKNLGDAGSPSPLLLREPQLAQSRAALASAEAALEQARRDLQRTEIKAPFAGRVGEKNVDVGQFVSKGAALARIYSVDLAEVRLPLAPDQLAYLDLPLSYRNAPESGQHPVVWLHGNLAGQTHTWTGRVDRTEGEIDTRTRMLSVVAQVRDPYGRHGPASRPPLAVGLFVEAEILGRTTNGVAVLPRSALRGTDQVLVIDPDHTLQFREVRVLRADRSMAVIGEGLREGELVCTSPLEAVTPKMRVRLRGDAGTHPLEVTRPAGDANAPAASKEGGGA